MDVLTDCTELKTLAEWMVYFKIVKTLEDAIHMCQIGLIRVDGNPCSNALAHLSSGSILSIQNGYSYQIPILV